MAIDITRLTNGSIAVNADDEYVWQGSGVFDDLMETINSNIKVEFDSGRIVGKEYSTVYLGALQSTLAQSTQFVLQEGQIEADLALKESQLVNERNKLEAELTKHWGFTVTRDETTDELVLGEPTGLGKIDEEVDLLQSQDVEVIANTVRSDADLADKLLNTANDRDIKTRGIEEQEATGALERLDITANTAIKTQQKLTEIKNTLLVQEKIETENKQNELNGVIDKQLLDIVKGTEVKERQMVEAESTGAKQRTLLDTEEEVKQFEITNILPKQVTKLEEEIDILQSEDAELLANGLLDRDIKERTVVVTETESSDKLLTSAKQRVLLDEERETADAQQLILAKELLIKTYENSTLQVDKHNTNIKQQILLDTEEELKQYEVDNILPEQLVKLEEEIDILESQDKEILANIERANASTNADIAVKAQQEIEIKERNGGYVVSYTYYTNGVDGSTSTTTDVSAVVGPIVSTTAVDGNGISIVSLEKQTMSKQQALLDEEVASTFTERLGKDKEVALLGLDDVIKETKGVNRESVYTTKYNKA